MKKTTLLLILTLMASVFSFNHVLASEPKGSVEKSVPGAWVIRSNKKYDLVEGSNICEFDIVKTDESGYVSIRFIDDSLMEIRGNSEVDIKEVAFSDSKNRFNVGLVQGASRIITGTIVKANPKGF